MVKRLATSPHDPLGITDSACKNQLVVVSVQYGPFNTYIPIRSTIIGNSGSTAGCGFNPAGGAPGGPSAITARWYLDTTNQSVTTRIIALYLSGTTHLSAGHNVALTQLLSVLGFDSMSSWGSVVLPVVVQVSQVIQLVVVLTQLEVPQEVVRVSRLCILFICTGITAGGMSRGDA
ncbi:hypothetical protein F511_42134 [Dorcoceras hygrometricum]|uniref:Uncharacterized protein n=1 Tax=Dorcoceras hygrometricum TaxID=472368 RepID=A0A2Z7CLY2_9LAMI|nr:hypothetical protein F511_42134 [Dorcoceras hygrometricum]